MDKYVKIVYQTPPIGPDKIVLYLTTFDKEAFERDQQLKPIEEKMVFEVDKYDIRDADFINRFEQNLNTIVKEYYIDKLNEIRSNK